MASAGDYCGAGRSILIIVQNLPMPFDRRVWQEACELKAYGYIVSIICPKGRGYEASYELINGIHIYRHPLPIEASGALGYALEYASSLFFEFVLAWKVLFAQGFDLIHACNPPDNIFLIGGFFKYLLGKRFLFDHHDITPELYEAKFGTRGFFYHVMRLWERLTFAVADVSIATNESYKRIAIERCSMPPDKVFVVRSGPSLERMKIVPPVPALKMNRQFLVGYVGVMGQQEGIQYLIEAVHILVHDLKRNDIHFTLVGDGPSLEELKRLAEAKAVSDFVTFTGRVADEELLQVLNTADICVNPDEVNAMNDKSTMNKIMEYMALGKPIVQFDVAEGKFSAGQASLYAKANDAQDLAEKIVALLADPAKRAAMGRFGRARVENELAWPYEAPKLLAAYEVAFSVTHWQEKLSWYYHRLANMSAAEMLHRKVEFLKRIWDKHYPCTITPADRGALPIITELREKLQVPDDIIAQWKSQAEAMRRDNYYLLGQHWRSATTAAKWHLDPVSGKSWPKYEYAFAVNYRSVYAMGDVKYVWELNRLQYLQPLAALAFIQKDKALAAFCISEIESWIDNNPPSRGINWTCGIELALRTISILVVTTFVGDQLTQAQRAKIWATLEAHALWLERYPSRYSSANNHMTAEGLGLFITGSLCTPLAGAKRWQRKGWQMLSESVQTQILADGVGAEQAITYSAFVLSMLRLAKYIASNAGVVVPEYYDQKLVQGAEYLRWFTDCAGNHPRIGDDDEAIVLDPQLSRALLGEWLQKSSRPDGVRIFDKGGYTVGCHQAGGREIWLAMDHGSLGFGAIAAHGHADALSIWLHINGQPVLVDAGTYLYHSGGAWRSYFRSTAAHNTLNIAGEDSSITAGNFNWSRKAEAKLNASQYGADGWWIEAEHDGYARKFSAVHKRRLHVTPATGFYVEDKLSGDEVLPVEIGFLLHPILTAKILAGRIEIYNTVQKIVTVVHESSLNARLDTAWYSASFGKKEQTTRIVFAGQLAPMQKAITKFIWAEEGNK